MGKCIKLIRVLLALVVVLGVPTQALSAGKQTCRDALALPGNLQWLQDINFGTFADDGIGGTVTVAPNGAITASAGINHLSGTGSAGVLTVTQPEDCKWGLIITWPISATITAGGNTMTLSGFTDDYDGTPVSLESRTVHVGATVTVGTPTPQPQGSYTGNFTVDVTY